MAKKAVPVTEDEKERQALSTQIEGDLPYERTLYINEVRYLMKHTAETIIEIGKRLLLIQEHEGKGNFTRIVEDEIGIPYRTAFRFMNVALKSEKYPRIEQLATVASCSKVYALLEAPEEELQKFEQLGLFSGKDVDELAALSRKELRELVQDLKANKDEMVKKEVKKVASENDLLRQELKEFHKLIPSGRENPSKSELQLMYTQAKYDEFESALGALCFATMEIEDIDTAARIDGLISSMNARIVYFHEKWEAHKKGEVIA